MNALPAQLQNAFAMLGGAGGMFGGGPTPAGSGVNWEVTKDTARKTVASLGPDPSPDGGQQRAIADAVSLAELWLDEATDVPPGQRRGRGLEPGGVDRADACRSGGGWSSRSPRTSPTPWRAR